MIKAAPVPVLVLVLYTGKELFILCEPLRNNPEDS